METHPGTTGTRGPQTAIEEAKRPVTGLAGPTTATPEQKLPVPVVVAHGLAGATTFVLVLTAAAKP